MSRIEGVECEDHDECEAGVVGFRTDKETACSQAGIVAQFGSGDAETVELCSTDSRGRLSPHQFSLAKQRLADDQRRSRCYLHKGCGR